MTGAPIPIHQDRDFYIPQFQVRLNDQPLGRDVIHDIISVTYRDNIEEFDSVEIRINNWDSQARSFKYSDGDLFLPGKELTVWMGYRGRDDLRRMLIGEITTLRPTFPASGQSTLAISGLNLLHRFQRSERTQGYPNKKDSEIALEIGDRVGVTVHPDPAAAEAEEPHDLFQYKEYDIIFLMARARRIGYELYVDECTGDDGSQESCIHFGPSRHVRTVTYTLKYGSSLVEFQPTLTTANQVYTVTVRGWHSVEARLIEESVSRDNIDEQGGEDEGDQEEIQRAFRERHEIIVDQPIESDEEARRMARSALLTNAGEMVRGSGSTLGLPDLRAGRYIQIEGLGQRFTGRYFVTATTHTIDSGGYMTRFDCRKEEMRSGA